MRAAAAAAGRAGEDCARPEARGARIGEVEREGEGRV